MLRTYRARNKGMQILLSNSQAGPGRKFKQEQEEISRYHVQGYKPFSRSLYVSFKMLHAPERLFTKPTLAVQASLTSQRVLLSIITHQWIFHPSFYAFAALRNAVRYAHSWILIVARIATCFNFLNIYPPQTSQTNVISSLRKTVK